MTTLEAASLLLIVTDLITDTIDAVFACDGVDEALDRIAATVTHPEEDVAAVADAIGATWAEHVAAGGRPAEFLLHRTTGAPIGRPVRFAMFPVERIGSSDLPDATRPAASTADPDVIAARMLRLIDADLAERGWSPVTCFADLHNFCDANDYVAEALDHDYRLGTADEDLEVINAATAIVDARLIARHVDAIDAAKVSR